MTEQQQQNGLEIRRVADWTHTKEQMPKPGDILAAARQIPEAPRYVCASAYAQAIDDLRKKGYTWREITEWLEAKGVDFSLQSIVSAWRNWKRRNPQLLG